MKPRLPEWLVRALASSRRLRPLSTTYRGNCRPSAKMGHFETREGYCYEECRASFLRVLL